MSSIEIIDKGHQIWKQNWKTELLTFFILGAITLVFVLPIALILGLAGTENRDAVFWFLAIVLAYVIFMNISRVVATVQIVDKTQLKNDEVSVTNTIYTLASKTPRLMVLSAIYLVIIGIPTSLVLFNTHQFYIENILLGIIYGGLYLVFMVIFGIPWFFCVRCITFKDEPIFSSVWKSWKLLYANFEKIFPTAVIAVLPVFLLGSVLFILGLTIPEGSLLPFWIMLIIVDVMVMGLIIMPWSLNITYPLFNYLENEFKEENEV